MIRIALAVAVVALGASVVAAQQDPIATRKALMKGVGDQNRIAGELIDAKRPFDLNTAKAVLTTLGDNAAKMPDLFPDNSKTGDTAALPAVWDNKSDFNAKMAKFSADAKAAVAKVTNLDTFKAEMGEVRKSCGGCHQTYRKRT